MEEEFHQFGKDLDLLDDVPELCIIDESAFGRKKFSL